MIRQFLAFVFLVAAPLAAFLVGVHGLEAGLQGTCGKASPRTVRRPLRTTSRAPRLGVTVETSPFHHLLLAERPSRSSWCNRLWPLKN
jgi:hypothetical protein